MNMIETVFAGRLRAWTGSLWGRWVLVNAGVQLAALILFRQAQPGTILPSMVWTVLFALLFWYPWLLRPLAPRPWLLRVVCVIWLAWILAAVMHRRYLGDYPNHGTLEFAVAEPFYAWLLLKDRLHLWMLPWVALPLLGGWWLAKGAVGRPRPGAWRWACLVATLALLVGLDQAGIGYRAMGSDVTTLRMLAESRVRRMGKGGLRRALARETLPASPPPPFHILILVHESMNEQGQDPERMPSLGARLARGELLLFSRAYAPGSMTNVALPAIFTGLSPARPSVDFHHDPLLWHRAKAAGMATALFSIQRMNYYGFPDYLLADGLDAWSSADELKLPLVNDAGGDDALLVERYRQWLRAKAGQLTFTVLHFNATHAPYLQAPGFTGCSADDVARLSPGTSPGRRVELARYWNALHYLDAIQERLFAVLAEQGILDHTWVIATSDHGENFEGPAEGRAADLRQETLHVPLWMRLPAGFPKAWAQALRANGHRLTSNLDLAPTLAQALGHPMVGRDRSGASLLERLGPERSLAVDNSGEIQLRDPAVGGVLWEEGDRILAWRSHPVEGEVLERVTGASGSLEPWTPARRERVRAVLAAHPVMGKEGIRLH